MEVLKTANDDGTLVVVLVIGVLALLLLGELVKLAKGNGLVKMLSWLVGFFLTVLLLAAVPGAVLAISEENAEMLIYAALIGVGWAVQKLARIPKLWCRCYLVAFSLSGFLVWRFIGIDCFEALLGEQTVSAVAIAVAAAWLSVGGSLLGGEEDTLTTEIEVQKPR